MKIERCSWKFRKFYKKAPMLESLFDEAAGKVFKNSFFYRTLPVAVSVVFAAKQLNIQCYSDRKSAMEIQ